MGIIPIYEISDDRHGDKGSPASSRAEQDDKGIPKSRAASRRYRVEADEVEARYEAEMWSAEHHKAEVERLSWELKAEDLEQERERRRRKARERDNKALSKYAPHRSSKGRPERRSDHYSDEDSRYTTRATGIHPMALQAMKLD